MKLNQGHLGKLLMLLGAVGMLFLIYDMITVTQSRTERMMETQCPFVGFAFLNEDPQSPLTGAAKMMYMCNDGTVRFEEIER